jgi:hypothetical protein
MGIKKAEFDAEFEFIEKVAKKFTRRKLHSRVENFCTQYLNVKKYIIPITLTVLTFFVCTFYNFFN